MRFVRKDEISAPTRSNLKRVYEGLNWIQSWTPAGGLNHTLTHYYLKVVSLGQLPVGTCIPRTGEGCGASVFLGPALGQLAVTSSRLPLATHTKTTYCMIYFK